MTPLIKLIWPTLILVGFAAIFKLNFDFVGLSFLFITLQSAIFLGLSTVRPASLFIVYWVFGYSFLGLIPWLQYSKQVVIWRVAPLETMTYIHTNTAIFIANIATFIAYYYVIQKRGARTTRSGVIRRPQLTAFLLLALSAIGLLGVLYINNFNLRLLLFRGLVDQTRDTVFTSSAFALIFGMISRLLPAFAFYFSVTELQRHTLLKFVLLAILVLAVFPTGVARYFVAYTYIPIMMIVAPMIRRGMTFALVLLLALLFVFPFLNQFRHFSNLDQIKLSPSEQFFFAAHFDAYENFASAVEAHFISDGYQLLGALLFFVPRSMWSWKPVGSGSELAHTLRYPFDNISMPFLGEGYVNFGFVGIFLFAIVIGCALGLGDRILAPDSMRKRRLSYKNTIYYFFFGGIFFVLRGDLLSSFAYLSAGVFVAWFVGSAMRYLNMRRRA